MMVAVRFATSSFTLSLQNTLRNQACRKKGVESCTPLCKITSSSEKLANVEKNKSKSKQPRVPSAGRGAVRCLCAAARAAPRCPRAAGDLGAGSCCVGDPLSFRGTFGSALSRLLRDQIRIGEHLTRSSRLAVCCHSFEHFFLDFVGFPKNQNIALLFSDESTKI